MSTLGIIGAGQLGQMLGFAANRLGINSVFLDPSTRPPAEAAGTVLQFAFDDARGLAELAARADVLSYEFENVPVDSILALPKDVPVYPRADALRAAQDRLLEKRLFKELGIPTPKFRNVESEEDLHLARREIGFPFVLKTRRLGYDGKGQAVISDAQQMADAWRDLGTVPLIAEAFVTFDYEVSAIGARRRNGEAATYPLSQNRHRNGILRTSTAPAGTRDLTVKANKYHAKLLAKLDYVGVLALELFVVGDQLLANEFAPRVHNSGHWTIEGAATSQFENHVRAVMDLPLGDASAIGHVAMENLIGEMPERTDDIGRQGFHVHDYGKQSRPGRKLGHITLVADSPLARDRELDRLHDLLAT